MYHLLVYHTSNQVCHNCILIIHAFSRVCTTVLQLLHNLLINPNVYNTYVSIDITIADYYSISKQL